MWKQGVRREEREGMSRERGWGWEGGRRGSTSVPFDWPAR